jgi:hypothetical protein
MYKFFASVIVLTGLLQSCSKNKNSDPIVDPGGMPVETATLKLIPDSVFRVYLKTNVCPNAFDKTGKMLDITNSEVVNFSGTMTIDTVTCPKPYAASLKGIEYFTKMKKLLVKNAPIDSLNLTSSMAIDTLRLIQDIDLQFVNVSGCNNMRFFKADGVPAASLNLSNLAALNYITLLDMGRLSDLNITNDANLQHLITYSAIALKTVNVSTNPNLRRLFFEYASALNSIDVTHNPKLRDIAATFCGSLKKIDLSKCDSLRTVKLDQSGIDSLDFSHNPKLFTVAALFTPLKNLNFLSNPELRLLWLDGCVALQNVDLRAQASFDYYYIESKIYSSTPEDEFFQVYQDGLNSPVANPMYPVEVKASRTGVNGATINLFAGLRLPTYPDAGGVSLTQVKVQDAVKDNYSLVMSRRVVGSTSKAVITVYAADKSTVLCNDYDPQLFKCN